MNGKMITSIVFALVTSAAHASGFDVHCTYSHTLPDDPIVYPGKPGEAMVHDFFGNTGTNAASTYDSLNNNKATTCDAKADISAYWAPQLKRDSGLVTPTYHKTYYLNEQPVVPVHPIPPGLEMLAGNHMGTSPNPHIEFLCTGSSGYSTTAPTNCPSSTPGGSSQLNISVHFPDCWDGKTLVPVLGTDRAKRMTSLMKAASGNLNVAYRNTDGTCPAAYPVKIPELQMNLTYDLGTDPSMGSAQLSLDPVLENGQWVPQWGSIYTAHGDFINAWHAQTMRYLTDMCLNKGDTPGACDTSIPTYYSAASANVQMDSAGTVQPAGATLVSAPNNMVLIKFPTPRDLDDFPYAASNLQTFGGNVSDCSTIMLDLYAASTDWDDTTHMPTAAACTSHYIGGIYLDNAQQIRLNGISGYVAEQVEAGAPQVGICIRNGTGKTVNFSSRTGSWTPGLFMQ